MYMEYKDVSPWYGIAAYTCATTVGSLRIIKDRRARAAQEVRMLIRNPEDGRNMPSREITPPETYFNRRTFLRGAVLVGSVAATAGLYRVLSGRGRKIRLDSGQKLTAAPTTPATGEGGTAVSNA